MDTQNILLLIITGINFVLAATIYFRNYRGHVNIAFGLTIFAAATWTFEIYMFRSVTDLNQAIIWAKAFYLTANLIALFFLFFAISFPYPIFTSLTKRLLIIFPTIIIVVLVFIPHVIVEDVVIQTWGKEVRLNSGYFIYIAYFISYVIWAYSILLKKFLKSEGIIRDQLKYTIFGTIIGFIFGTIFDLLLPLFGNYKLISIGPYFTVFASFFIYYFVFFKKYN